MTEYDEGLVRQLIEKITVYDDHLDFESKSGLETEVQMEAPSLHAGAPSEAPFLLHKAQKCKKFLTFSGASSNMIM